ncbi:MAG: vWA domain-containing protein [Elusimicrobiota bacterium]
MNRKAFFVFLFIAFVGANICYGRFNFGATSAIESKFEELQDKIEKNQGDESDTEENFYSDPSDFDTTEIKLSIRTASFNSGSENGVSAFSSGGGQLEFFASAMDQDGNPIENLNAYNFKLKIKIENASLRTIPSEDLYLNTVGESGDTVSTSLLMDYSGSMSSEDIDDMEVAVSTYVHNMSDNDEAEIIKFATYVSTVQPYTSDKNLLLEAATAPAVGIRNRTALYSAMGVGVENTAEREGLAAVLAFTDGKNNQPPRSYNDVVSTATALGIPIYTIGLGDVNAKGLKDIAESTKGEYFYSPDSVEIKRIYETISRQMAQTYKMKAEVDAQEGDTVTINARIYYYGGRGLMTASDSYTFKVN